MRRIAFLIVMAMAVAACGSTVVTDGEASGQGSSATSEAPPATSQPTETTSTSSAATPPTSGNSSGTTTTSEDLPPIDGPAAPDFSLELSDGSTFVLSEETRPVYMVFWAEW